jgi:hypothetical protein
MKNTYKKIMVFALSLFLFYGVFDKVFADHDEHEGKGRHQNRERNYSGFDDKRDSSMTTNPTYRENCGACHSAYPSGLLPSTSWEGILNGLSNHFGKAVNLDTDSKTRISEYLKANAADHSSGETAGKIMRSIGDQTPLRITEIPYIQKKHQNIGPDVLTRKSVGSLGNCSACHTTADQGVFDDDQVEIPE